MGIMHSGVTTADQMASIAARLQKPAGDSELFRTSAGIAANQAAFALECHKTWKALHDEAIEALLVFDAIRKSEKQRPIGHGVPEWIDYTQALWRRVSDAIVWEICGMERHKVKRLCFYRKRSALSESNPESVLGLLQGYNADPEVIALWNDATSCVDVGDITLVGLRTEGLQFLELKQGKVNELIAALLERTGEQEIQSGIAELGARFGEKGVKQLERVLRQAERNDQALTMLYTDKGRDPVTGREIEVGDLTHVDIDWYHERFSGVLEKALKNGDAMGVIDDCLWIYAVAEDLKLEGLSPRERFRKRLTERCPHLESPLKDPPRRNDLGRFVTLAEGLHRPVSLPIFLRPISAELVGQVTYGNLMHRVLMYLDWERFSELVVSAGASFEWGTGKRMRRTQSEPWELRPILAYGRLPTVRVGEVELHLTGANIDQMLFDGVTPASLVALLLAGGRYIERRAGENGDPQ